MEITRAQFLRLMTAGAALPGCVTPIGTPGIVPRLKSK
jgi:hypothetical protein